MSATSLFPAAAGRKVLIVEDDSSIRNVLYVLLASMRCEGEIAYDGRQALTMINRQQYDAILLDLRCYNLAPEKVMAGLKQIRPSLLGRVLIITGEVNDPSALEFFSQFSAPQIPRTRLIEELWPRLRTVLTS
jgi:two-component system, NtrC family, response regulator PilR